MFFSIIVFFLFLCHYYIECSTLLTPLDFLFFLEGKVFMLMLSSRFWLENKMVYPQIFSVMTIYEEKRSTFRIFINKKKIELNECMLMTSGLAINGEIYEKDIISHIDNPSVFGVVEYSFDKGGFIAKMGDKEINIGGDMSDYEIVGNTYETPELVPGFISNSNATSPDTDKTIVDDANNKTPLNADNNKKTVQQESEKSNSDNKIQEKAPNNKTQPTQQNKQQQSAKQTTANPAVSDTNKNNTSKQEPKQEIKQQSQKQEPKEVKETKQPKSEAPKKEEIKKETKQDNVPQKQEQPKGKNDTKNNPSVKQIDKKENEQPSNIENESLNQKTKDKSQTSKPTQNKNDVKEVSQKKPNSNENNKTVPEEKPQKEQKPAAKEPQQKQQPKQPQTQSSILNSLFSQASKTEKPKNLSEAIGNSKERKIKMFLKAEYLSDIKTGKLGYYIDCNGFVLKKLHTVEKTTERRTVLMTLIAALKEITYPCNITIFCNIHFIISPIKEGWLSKWAQNDWHHANGAIKDSDLWAEIYDICKQHEIVCQYDEDMDKYAEYRILSDLF